MNFEEFKKSGRSVEDLDKELDLGFDEKTKGRIYGNDRNIGYLIYNEETEMWLLELPYPTPEQYDKSYESLEKPLYDYIIQEWW